MRLQLAIAATRPQFLTASLLPVLIGTAWGWRSSGRFDGIAFVLALAATVLVHAASNVYNDISDDALGTDRINAQALRPFTGGSGLLQSAAISAASMRRLALWLCIVAAGCGSLLAVRAGPVVIALGAFGLVLGLLYSMPGIRLSGRGLGELTIAIAFGPLPVTGAAWLQTGVADPGAMLASLPVAAWVAGIILANEVPDAAADGATGKLTLAVRLGSRTALLYVFIQGAGFVAYLVLVAMGLLPAWTAALPFFLFAVALTAAPGLAATSPVLARSIRATLAIHGIGCSWLLLVTAIAAAP